MDIEVKKYVENDNTLGKGFIFCSNIIDDNTIHVKPDDIHQWVLNNYSEKAFRYPVVYDNVDYNLKTLEELHKRHCPYIFFLNIDDFDTPWQFKKDLVNEDFFVLKPNNKFLYKEIIYPQVQSLNQIKYILNDKTLKNLFYSMINDLFLEESYYIFFHLENLDKDSNDKDIYNTIFNIANNKLKNAEITNKVIKINPHLHQVDTLIYFEGKFEDKDRYIKKTDGRAKYTKNFNRMRSTLHWGQRKLLINEIELLSKYAKRGDKVIYVGAAAGYHLVYLYNLFSHLKLTYDLYDTGFFNKNLHKLKGVNIYNEYYTDEINAKYRENKDNIIFLSDIRTLYYDPNNNTLKDLNKMADSDMRLQETWVRKLNPKVSMLKFRLPYYSEDDEETHKPYKYLDGEIRLQAWSGSGSSETRLIVLQKDSDSIKLYNNKIYEEQMYYFNTVTRVKHYDHDIKSIEGLDHCYDCRTEIYVLQQYKIHRKGQYHRDINTMSHDISNSINIHEKTLLDPPNSKDIEEREVNVNKAKYRKYITKASLQDYNDSILIDTLLSLRNINNVAYISNDDSYIKDNFNDVEEEMRYKWYEIALKIQTLNSFSLDDFDEELDLFFVNDNIYNLGNYKLLFEEVYELLRDGGNLLINYQTLYNPKLGILNDVRSSLQHNVINDVKDNVKFEVVYSSDYFSKNELRNYLLSLGFKIVIIKEHSNDKELILLRK